MFFSAATQLQPPSTTVVAVYYEVCVAVDTKHIQLHPQSFSEFFNYGGSSPAF